MGAEAITSVSCWRPPPRAAFDGNGNDDDDSDYNGH